MEELRLRPALRAYAIMYLSLIALLIAAAASANALLPDLGPIATAIAAFLGLLVLLKLLQRAYLHITTEYVVSGSMITQITGLWAKDETNVPTDKVQDYKIDRSFIGKLLGVAAIGIQTARGERGFEMVLSDIPEKDVNGVKQVLERQSKEFTGSP
jgi:uncharacterized membrane protein YdbT with pleckstrin-like domain